MSYSSTAPWMRDFLLPGANIVRVCLPVLAALLVAPVLAHAQAAPDTPAAPGADAAASGSQPNPATASAAGAPSAAAPTLSAICTDRPTKSNYACTVDAGHFQYEADVFNGSFLRLDGVTTDTYLATNPTLKYGITSNLDVEANLSPLEIVHTSDKFGDDRTIAGVGDLILRLKYEFLNTTGGKLQAAIIPYVKAPTARIGIGNGVVEGGSILPINYKLTDAITLTTVPEVDALLDSNGGGRHLNTAQLVNVGVSLPKNFTVYGELYGDWNFDPVHTIRQYSADFAVAYGVTSELQLDMGVNFGLNRETAGAQAYVGVSQKF